MIANAVSQTQCLQNCKLLALFPSSNFGQMFSAFLDSSSPVPPCTRQTYIQLPLGPGIQCYLSPSILLPHSLLHLPPSIPPAPCHTILTGFRLVSVPSAISLSQHYQKIKICLPSLA